METLSYEGAAQRLGINVSEVETLIETKELKKAKNRTVTLESVYAYSGLTPGGRQTASRKAGRKPTVISFAEAAEMLNAHFKGGAPADADSVSEMAFEDVLEEYEIPSTGKMGVTKRSVDKFISDNPVPADDGTEKVTQEKEVHQISDEDAEEQARKQKMDKTRMELDRQRDKFFKALDEEVIRIKGGNNPKENEDDLFAVCEEVEEQFWKKHEPKAKMYAEDEVREAVAEAYRRGMAAAYKKLCEGAA